jgi:hypothetical protein
VTTGDGAAHLDSMFTSSELTEYGTVRLRLRKTRMKFTSFEVAGKTVRLGEWTYFDTTVLSQSERREFVVIATRDWYEFEAHIDPDAWEGAGWVPLSAWRREELRIGAAGAAIGELAGGSIGEAQPAEAPTVAGDHRAAVVAEMRHLIADMDKEPSAGDFAWRLKRNGLLIPDIIEALRELGFNNVDAGNIHDHLKYGKRLEAKRQKPS